MIVGLGGKVCSGKSSAAGILERHGYRIIDVDRIGHRALRERQEAIAERFGAAIVTDDAIDRSALSAIVFTDEGARRDLEAIVHPVMVTIIREEIEAHRNTPIALHAALLFVMGLDRLCDTVVWLQAPLIVRLVRVLRRGTVPFARVWGLFHAQRSLVPQLSSPNVDIHRVYNIGSMARLQTALHRLGLIRGMMK